MASSPPPSSLLPQPSPNPLHPPPPPTSTTSTTTTSQPSTHPTTSTLTHHPAPSTTTSHPSTHHAPAPPSSTTLQNPVLITQARQALVASIGNMLDSSLRDRASVLHANQSAIAKQEKDVIKATDGLRKENDKLSKVAGDAARKVKELGNVQNWAEVLERDFLVLEETLRLVRGGGDGNGDERSWSGSGSGSWSGSETGSESGREAVDGDGDMRMDGTSDGQPGKGKGKGKGKEVEERMDVDQAEAGSVVEANYTTGGVGTMDVDMDMSLPPVRIGRGEASLKVPGLESAESSKSLLEDELRSAMAESIGEAM